MEIIFSLLVFSIFFLLLITLRPSGLRSQAAFGSYFLLLFLPLWAIAIWLPPASDFVWGGMRWEFAIFSLILALILILFSPTSGDGIKSQEQQNIVSNNPNGEGYRKFYLVQDTGVTTKIGMFFLGLITISIVIGYAYVFFTRNAF